MKKISMLLLTFVLVFGLSMTAFAQQRGNETKVVVDLKNLDDLTRNKIIDSMKKAESSGLPIDISAFQPEAIKAWVNAVSEGIKDVCHNLNVEVNDFIKTPAGMIITGSIIYKVIGKDIFIGVKDIVFGILGWVVSMLLLFLIARRFVLTRKIKILKEYEEEIDGKKRMVKLTSYKFIKPYEFKSDDARSFAFAALIIPAVAFTIAAMIIVL